MPCERITRLSRSESKKVRDIINNSQGELVSSIPNNPIKSRKRKRNSYYLKKLNRKLKYSQKTRDNTNNDVGVNTDLTIDPVSEIRSISVWNGISDERYDYFDRISYNRNGSIQSIQRNFKQSR